MEYRKQYLIKYLIEKKVPFAINEMTGNILPIRITHKDRFYRANNIIIPASWVNEIIKYAS